MDWRYDPNLALYLPLHELDGSSFMSKDAYGHLCTATGALWRPNGRYFDGSDDRIVTGATVPYNTLNILTAIAWINIADNTDPRTFLSWGSTGSGNKYLGEFSSRGLYIAFANYGSDWTTLNTLFSADTWYHVAIIHDGNLGWVKIFVGGEIDTDEAYAQDVLSTIDVVTVGCNNTATPSEYFKGQIGEVWLYNRALTPQEIQNNYLATKWRYR